MRLPPSLICSEEYGTAKVTAKAEKGHRDHIDDDELYLRRGGPRPDRARSAAPANSTVSHLSREGRDSPVKRTASVTFSRTLMDGLRRCSA
jgi:hypothetical protein